MDFSVYDNSEIEQYKDEVKAKWGDAPAYREYEEKAAARTPGQQAAADRGLLDIFAALGALRDQSPEAEAVQAQVRALQQYITDNYYTCTTSILRGLGQMYGADDRFRRNIDAVGGEGTAAFASRAIALYCAEWPGRVK